MEGVIINYRRGKRTQKPNQMIIVVEEITDKETAEKKLLEKSVKFVCEGKNKKIIKGKIVSTHGNKGAVRAIFEKGMPGQAIGQKVIIE